MTPSPYTIDDLLKAPTSGFKDTPGFRNNFDEGVVPERIIAGAVAGNVQSPNYESNVAGWIIKTNGDVEFNDGIFRGDLTIGGTIKTVNTAAEIQTAINEVDAAGGGIVYLAPGTYNMTASITIPSGVYLEGTSRDETIIDFGSGAYQILIQGTDAYNTGTISINDGDTTVVGSGTTFTSGMVGRMIFLSGFWYEITAFTDTTHITIGSAYAGSNLSGASYVIATTVANVQVGHLVVQNSSISGIKAQYASEVFMDNVNVYSCDVGFDYDYVVYPRIVCTADSNATNIDFDYVSGFFIDFSFVGNSTTGHGMDFNNCQSATIFNTEVSGNTGDGINCTTCSKLVFMSLDVNTSGGQGVEMVSGNSDCQFVGVTVDDNTSDGFKLTATSDRISISTCSIINNGGYGVNIAASTCDNNYIVAPSFNNNTSGDINDSGTSTSTISESDVTTGRFGGTGSDGALSVSSGTTTIDLNGERYVVKNYTSISITGTGKVAFSNPHANGSYIVLKSQGNVTLTSSTAPMLDASGMGGAAGTTTGANGTSGQAIWSQTNAGTGGGVNGGAAGGAFSPQFSLNFLDGKSFKWIVGAGGGAGADGINANGSNGRHGDGGRGGGALIIECKGSWNFTTASGISVKGADGANGTNGAGGSNVQGGGGGGSGGGGTFIGIYETLVANSGTVVATAGTAGTGGTGVGSADGAGSGGGGGGSMSGGTNGSDGTNPDGGNGGTGGDGVSLIAQNTTFS